ncbi:kinase-like domain-containing protein [Mycena olivaceomarginata]|nr:kinase-like domain-containing protein [Mycena olivaceomarginata]
MEPQESSRAWGDLDDRSRSHSDSDDSSEMWQSPDEQNSLDTNPVRSFLFRQHPFEWLELDPWLAEEEESGREVCFGEYDGRLRPRFLAQINPWQNSGGGNAITYMGNLTVFDGSVILVAFKVIRTDLDADLFKYYERLDREANVWQTLKHPNILPFFGVYNIGRPLPVLISPFYKFGHIGHYLQTNPTVARNSLVHDVASGLKFLHDNGVVHGDLKAENILVDKNGVACICDSGMSRIQNVRGFTTSHRAGTMVYMAPELLMSSNIYETRDQPVPRTTMESDIWTLALVLLGILTSFPLKTAARLEALGRVGMLSSRPDLEDMLRPTRMQYTPEAVSSAVWALLKECWHADPASRPTMSTIMESRVIEEMEEVILYPRRSEYGRI